jgi:tRNA uridine 5-carbamoylmethylation protein Kti12
MQFPLQEFIMQCASFNLQLMKNSIPEVIIIKGAPGSGKTQSAKCLSKFFPKGVRMEIDNLRSMVISVNWTNQNEHISLLKLSTKLVYEFLQLGYSPVIVVDTFSGDKILKYIEDLNAYDKDLNVKIFGLYTTEEELRKRIELREEDQFRDFEVCKNINEDVLKHKNNEEFLIDTTGLTPQETAKNIYSQIPK